VGTVFETQCNLTDNMYNKQTNKQTAMTVELKTLRGWCSVLPVLDVDSPCASVNVTLSLHTAPTDSLTTNACQAPFTRYNLLSNRFPKKGNQNFTIKVQDQKMWNKKVQDWKMRDP